MAEAERERIAQQSTPLPPDFVSNKPSRKLNLDNNKQELSLESYNEEQPMTRRHASTTGNDNGGPIPDNGATLNGSTQANNESQLSSDKEESNSAVPDSFEARFQSRVEGFLNKHSELFDKLIYDFDTREHERYVMAEGLDRPPIETATDNYCVLNPPIECYWGVEPSVRKQRFFKLIKPGDLVKAVVLSSSATRGITVRVVAIAEESCKLRYIKDLNIKGLICPEDICIDDEDRDKIVDDLYKNDIVRAAVVSVDEEQELLNLSFKFFHITDTMRYRRLFKLGYMKDMREEDIPTFNPEENLEPDSCINTMLSSAGFNNPTATDNLKEALGIPLHVRATFLEHLLIKRIPDVEYYDGLKFMQRRNWSMKLTKSGIKYFKRDRLELATAYFDFAIDVDNANVECLVARGALNANRGLYNSSICDFDRALRLTSTHKNARKYMTETCLAYAESLEKKGDVENALTYYEKAHAADPSSDLAKSKVKELSAILVKQGAEKEEAERKKLEEQERLKKLKKIIRKEKRKMKESDMHGPREKPSKRIKKKKRKSKSSSGSSKHRRRSGSSSRSSTSSRKSKKQKKYSSSSSYTSSDYSTLSESSSDSETGTRRKKTSKLRKKL